MLIRLSGAIVKVCEIVAVFLPFSRKKKRIHNSLNGNLWAVVSMVMVVVAAGDGSSSKYAQLFRLLSKCETQIARKRQSRCVAVEKFATRTYIVHWRNVRWDGSSRRFFDSPNFFSTYENVHKHICIQTNWTAYNCWCVAWKCGIFMIYLCERRLRQCMFNHVIFSRSRSRAGSLDHCQLLCSRSRFLSLPLCLLVKYVRVYACGSVCRCVLMYIVWVDMRMLMCLLFLLLTSFYVCVCFIFFSSTRAIAVERMCCGYHIYSNSTEILLRSFECVQTTPHHETNELLLRMWCDVVCCVWQ